MLRYVKGDILEGDADALVNTVNCVGVMGKGIALQFKQAFPDYFKDYKRSVDRHELRPGRLHVYRTKTLRGPQYLISFPTKQHWRERSKLENIEDGLEGLREIIQDLGIESIAVPPLGCGSGGLNWQEVKARIEEALAQLQDVDILVYEPSIATPRPLKVATKRPNMTRSVAVLLAVFDRYLRPGDELTLLEAQKLAYFCYLAGELSKIKFRRDRFGPYAPQLNNILERMEGHFTRGYRGDRSPRAKIVLVEGAIEEAMTSLGQQKDGFQRLDSIAEMIEGFETSYGIELLASVQWVASEHADAAEDVDVAVRRIHAWNARKARIMKADHIRIAWQRLKEQHWLP